MATPPVSDDEIRTTVEAYIANNKNQVKTANALGCSRARVQDHIKKASERGMLGFDPVLDGYRIKKITTVSDQNGQKVREFIQQVQELGGKFEVPDDHFVREISAYTDAQGNLIGKWTKTSLDRGDEAMIEALKKTFAEYSGTSPLVPAPKKSDADLLSVYPIADQHNGLLAWGPESGEDYDLKIGADRLRSSIARLVEQSPASETAVVLNLGDWQHTDDAKNMTPRSGNILDVDSRYFKILITGVQLMIDCIVLALKKHKKVIVRNIPGNHDPHASIALTVALSAFFANNPRVQVDVDPSDFFFYRFGKTLIGATHGHKLKPDRMAMVMASVRKQDWGETDFHYFYFGHIHHETVKEVGGVRCESFQTLSARDAHHTGAGYTSGQSITSITIDKDQGEIGRHRVNLPAPPYPKFDFKWRDAA
ncbi:hypothetical protein [Pseudolabrys sp.]|uniref:hypothetical protein n=1 Tax=Pseudolabrys sp. TaxID=1960880 RepID=UPI003D0FD286